MTKTQQLVKTLYKNNTGQPFLLTESQDQIFTEVFKKIHSRVNILTYTQYGKSETVSMAVLTRASTFAEKWTIIAPSDKKAKIIMNAAIGHIFDNPYTIKKFEIGKDESLERIRRERSKSKLTFKTDGGIGELLILSAEAHRQKDFEKALMGFGSPNIIEDEAGLIPDNSHSTVIRMLGGSKENFLVKIGNPFYRNHFYKSSKSDLYEKIVVDYKKGIAEGRISEEFIKECRENMTEQLFDVLYNCNFPDDKSIDAEGYQVLFPYEVIGSRLQTIESIDKSEKCLGVDVSQGGAQNVFFVRYRNYGYVAHKDHNPDPMSTAGKVLEIMESEGIDASNIFIDDTGIGGGVTARLREQEYFVRGVRVGESAEDGKFANKKAEIYIRAVEWLKTVGFIKYDDELAEELSTIKYKMNSSGKLQIQPKEQLRLLGIDSPDIVDAFALTFTNKFIPVDTTQQKRKYNPITGYVVTGDDEDEDLRTQMGLPPLILKNKNN